MTHRKENVLAVNFLQLEAAPPTAAGSQTNSAKGPARDAGAFADTLHDLLDKPQASDTREKPAEGLMTGKFTKKEAGTDDVNAQAAVIVPIPTPIADLSITDPSIADASQASALVKSLASSISPAPVVASPSTIPDVGAALNTQPAIAGAEKPLPTKGTVTENSKAAQVPQTSGDATFSKEFKGIAEGQLPVAQVETSAAQTSFSASLVKAEKVGMEKTDPVLPRAALQKETAKTTESKPEQAIEPKQNAAPDSPPENSVQAEISAPAQATETSVQLNQLAINNGVQDVQISAKIISETPPPAPQATTLDTRDMQKGESAVASLTQKNNSSETNQQGAETLPADPAVSANHSTPGPQASAHFSSLSLHHTEETKPSGDATSKPLPVSSEQKAGQGTTQGTQNHDSQASAGHDKSQEKSKDAITVTTEIAVRQESAENLTTTSQPAQAELNYPAAHASAVSSLAQPEKSVMDSPSQSPAAEKAPVATTMADAPQPHAPLTGDIQTARIMERMGQSEMHIDLKTPAFGSVEVHTVIRDSQVGLAVGSERGDLRSFLGPEIPALQSTLGQHNLQFDSVRYLSTGATFNGGLSAGTDSQSHSYPQGQSQPHTSQVFEAATSNSEETDFPAGSMTGPMTGLNVHA